MSQSRMSPEALRRTNPEIQRPPAGADFNVMPSNQEYEELIAEKNQLERALQSVQNLLQTTVTEKEQLSKLYNDFKSHFSTIKSQCAGYQSRLVEEMTTRKNLEQENEMRVNQLKMLMENKQKEIDHLTQKMSLPVDQDILRMRIQKDLENKYRFDLDSKQLELEKVSENYFENKRQTELLKTQVESLKLEYDKVITDIKKRHQEEINEIVQDNFQLQLRIEDIGKDRDVTRQLRRDIDDLKRRLGEAQQESLDLRKERDQLKIDKNELLMKNARDVEQERNIRRVLQTENDKIKFQIKCFEDDLSKVQLKCERKTQEVQGAYSEKTSLLTVLKEKEIMIDSIRRQLAQTKEDLHLKEQELDAYVRRAVSEDKDKSVMERKEKSRIHKELETLERNYADLTHQSKADMQIKKNEVDNLNKVLAQFEDDKSKYLSQISNLENQLRETKKKLVIKEDQLEVLEKEFAKLQEKFRESQNIEFNLSTQKEHQDATVKIQEDQIQKLQSRYQEDENQWKGDRQEYQKQIQDLFIQLDKTKRESNQQVQQYKTKYSDYKVKVKQANAQINTLTQKLAQMELQKQQQQQ